MANGTYKALVLSDFAKPLEVQDLLVPEVTPGTATVSVLSAPVLSYASALYSGQMQYPMSLPLTVGASAVARVHAAPPDATKIKEGDLVLVDATARRRDDPINSQMLLGAHAGINPGSNKLMEGEWRHGTCGQMAKVPLENLFVLKEDLLVKSMGYNINDFAYLTRLLVPAGGLCELDVRAGDRVLIVPATGGFSGAATEVARAMGADVILAARNKSALETLKANFLAKSPNQGKIDIVALTGDLQADATAITAIGGPVDYYIDISPAQAAKSTHFIAGLMSLKKGGKACFMGGILTSVELPYGLIMFCDLKIMGKFMYGREVIERVLKLVENGSLKLGKERAGVEILGNFGLEQWEEAFALAKKETGWGKQVVFDLTT